MELIDEIYVMRKIVVDGSNVSGFQRTMLVAFNGSITVEDRKIGIQTSASKKTQLRK